MSLNFNQYLILIFALLITTYKAKANPIINDFPWSGNYFKDIPITIEAIPYPGYIFEGWNSSDENKNPMTLSLQSNTTYISAIFKGPNSLPNKIDIFQNYPNPFNPTTNIHYSLDRDNFVDLIIYDLKGQKVKTIINQFQKAGQKYVSWDSTNDNKKTVSSGIYFFTLKSGNFIKTKKMILVK